MKLQKAVVKETLRIAVGTLILAAIMNVVFLIIGAWEVSVLLGSLLGSLVSVGNFLLLGITIQQITSSDGDEKRNRLKLQFSYSVRMFALIVIIIVAIQFDIFNWIAVAIPLLFPRITIMIMQITGAYKPEKKAEKGGNNIDGNND